MSNKISVGLIHGGGALVANIDRLVRLLNSQQKEFEFEKAGEPFYFSSRIDFFIQEFDGTGHSFYTPETLINAASSFKKSYDYLIVLTGLRIADDFDKTWFPIKRFAPECRYETKEYFPDLDYFSEEDTEKGIAVMTEYNYHKYCKETKISVYDYFFYLISCSLLSLMARSMREKLLARGEVKGCIGDYCYDQKEIVQSILHARICPKCIAELADLSFTKEAIEAIQGLINFIIKKTLFRKIQRGLSYWYNRLSQDLISVVLIGISTSLIASIFNRPWAKISAFIILIGLGISRIIYAWRPPYRVKPN